MGSACDAPRISREARSIAARDARGKPPLLDTPSRRGLHDPRLDGAVAQLGERRVRNAEVRGSTPLGSTSPPDDSRKMPFSVSDEPCSRRAADFLVRKRPHDERENHRGDRIFLGFKNANGRQSVGSKNRLSPVELTAGYALPEADVPKVFARVRPTRAIARATKSRL